MFAHPERDGAGVAGEDHDPHQDRSLERAPHGGEVVERRRRPAPHLLHVGEREVACDHRMLHRGERPRRGNDEENGEARDQLRDVLVTSASSGDRGERTEQRRDDADEEESAPDRAAQPACCEHAWASASFTRSAFFAMYSFECLTSMRFAWKVSPTRRPCATTGMHSWKMPPGSPS